MSYRQQAKIITVKEAISSPRQYSKTWIKAAGILRAKKKALAIHIRNIRKEWD